MTTIESPRHDPAKATNPNRGDPPWLRSLDEIEGADLPQVGGKAFRLAVLKQNGFQVPPGLVVTTHFFETQLRHARLVPLWAGSPDVAVTAEALTWLADSLKTKPLAPALSAALSHRLEALVGTAQTSFAVRSSVIDEDQRDHTFAGLHLTELGVPRGALVIALTRCWASALTGPAINYRQAHGMAIQRIKVAILIQPMLRPACSGVAFSINPLTGARDELIIEASWGLGDRLVTGQMQPHFYRLSFQPPDYPLLEQRWGDLPPGKSGSPLTPRELAHIARQLGRVQALMGQPQDVEWARQGDRLYLLQTRPVSGPPPPEAPLNQEWLRLDRFLALPELPSPLAASLLERSQAHIRTVFGQLNMPLDSAIPIEITVLGRPYLNLTFLKEVLVRLGINPDSYLPLIGVPAPNSSRAFTVDWRRAWQARRMYGAVLKLALRLEPALEIRRAKIEQSQQILESGDITAPRDQLLHQLRQQDEIYGQLMAGTLALTISAAFVSGLGNRLIAPDADAPAGTVGALAQRRLTTAQSELDEALRSLARSLDRDQLETLAPDFPAEGLFGQLLARFGHHAQYELDPGWPRYGEAPAVLVERIRQLAAHRALGRQTDAPATGPGSWRQRLLQPIVSRLGHLQRVEDRFERTGARALAVCRQWSLRLGQKWVESGRLNQPQDIFWLAMAEIEQAIMGEQGAAVSLASTVQARKESYRDHAGTEMPAQLQNRQLPFIQSGARLSAAADDVIIGLPISPGQASGKVVVITRPDQLNAPSGEDIILVMASTDPAWLAQLHRAAGLIIETGGLLSHGSIIAREYGLPAVADIPGATQRFNAGDMVLVDGTTGVVQLLEPAPSAVSPTTT